MERTIRLVREEHADEPALDTAISRAMLLPASEGRLDETFRLHTPGRAVAFGKRDTIDPGYRSAVAAARSAGFVPVERIAGGRAAVFHEGTLAFSWTIPTPDARTGIRDRFRSLAELNVRALRRLGVPAQVGEVDGEYCPGEWSVNAGGRVKLMGVGQRLARGAAHVGGVVVVSDAPLVNTVLGPVYQALGLSFRPEATGAVEDVVGGVTNAEVAAAVEAEVHLLGRVLDTRIDRATLSRARRVIPEHLPSASL